MHQIRKQVLLQNCLVLQAGILEKQAVIESISEKKQPTKSFPDLAELSRLSIDDLSRYYLDLKKLYDTIHKEQQIIIDRFARSSKTDGLTGLFNQKYFTEQLKNEISRTYWGIKNNTRSKGLAVLFIDMDDFKNFNTFYGHLSGNKVLEIVAKCISSTIRRSDVAARFGGDEFVVMLPETDNEGAIIVANNLIRNLSMIGLKASIGVSEYTPSEGLLDLEEEAARLLNRADKAMYIVKQNGKNKAIAL